MHSPLHDNNNSKTTIAKSTILHSTSSSIYLSSANQEIYMHLSKLLHEPTYILLWIPNIMFNLYLKSADIKRNTKTIFQMTFKMFIFMPKSYIEIINQRANRIKSKNFGKFISLFVLLHSFIFATRAQVNRAHFLCLFQFLGQANWQEIQELGLSIDYVPNKKVRTFEQRVLSLSHVPLVRHPEALRHLQDQVKWFLGAEDQSPEENILYQKL